jgi:hypothetical protein
MRSRPIPTPTGVVSCWPVLETFPPPLTLLEPDAALKPWDAVLPLPETLDVAVAAVPGMKRRRRMKGGARPR